MNGKQVSKIPAGCREVFQEWVGEEVNLDDVVLYVFDEKDAVIISAFIGYAVSFYRLFTIGGEWVISVDASILLDELQSKTGATE